MSFLHSRTIAEHFSRLSTLLESEALRCGALGIASSDKLYREAVELQQLAEALWQEDERILLPDLPRRSGLPAASARLRRASIAGLPARQEGREGESISGFASAPAARSA